LSLPRTSADGAPLVALVDYGMGNRRSVQKALEHVGARVIVTPDHEELRGADALVLPGVGAFPAAMARIQALGLDELIRERVATGIPLLGICLGMQLLFERSDELGGCDGLGILRGDVTELRAGGARLPHIGWNDAHFVRDGILTAGQRPADTAYYHVHSFAVRPADAGDVLATAEYGERFVTIVEHGNLVGVQFHPEKSSADGLALLSNFVSFVARRCAAEPGAVARA
jgi:imidazole glycerol-phosphate synthase subunit HisH